MRKTYRVLANILAIEVALQAMLIVFGIAGLFKWINDGATLDKSVIDSWETTPPTFEGSIGPFIHFMNGQFLIPLIGLIFLVVSFFAKVPRGVMYAAVMAVMIVVQVTAGLLAESAPLLGLVHGLGALVIFSVALVAAKAAKAAKGAGAVRAAPVPAG